MTYGEKLKDPRWQKMRLKILERDEWECKQCFDSENTLHIHHRRYRKNKDPWEYSENLLITLCEPCHIAETEYLDKECKLIGDVLRDKFFSQEISEIAIAFYEMPSGFSHPLSTRAICWMLTDKIAMTNLINSHSEHLEKTRKNVKNAVV